VKASRGGQWRFVGLVAVGLAVGAWALTKYAAPVEGAQIGDMAPDFKVQQLTTGDSIALRSHYAGQVVLVNLWATWCGPCRKEMPSMEAAYVALKDRGFRIAAISLDEGDAAPVRAFAEEMGLTFDIVQDRSNNSQQVYQALGVPHSVLVGRDGKVKWIALGAEDWNSPAQRARIEALLADGE
jgi:cytochrome c biogenesis protein CcmG/thiol:disulfide interchange protein DsbE